MIYTTNYDSPIGKILLASKDNALIGVWIEGQKHYLSNINEEIMQKDDIDIFIKTKQWLDKYFKREKTEIDSLKLNPMGSKFRQNVWEELCKIPYGKTTTYGEIAKKVAKKMNKTNMSAQAVGGAVGNNPISIIIPCHRVVGKDGNLTGYAGGIDKKIKLLKIEKVDMKNFYVSNSRIVF